MNIQTFEEHTPIVADSAFIHERALVIGNSTIEEDCSVWPGTIIRGDVNSIHIGARCNIQDNAICHVTHVGPYTPDGGPLILEHDITIGHSVNIHACHIKHHCLIGINAVILDHVIIEPYTMIGANTLVPPKKHLESGYLWCGSPARKVRPLTDDEKEYLDYSAKHYVRLKNRYQQQP